MPHYRLLVHRVALVGKINNAQRESGLNKHEFLIQTHNQHCTSGIHGSHRDSRREQLVYSSGCRAESACTGASSTFQPLVKEASSAFFCFFFFFLAPSHPVLLCLILDVNSEPVVERKQPTYPCTGWLLIKSQTAMSCTAPVGLGSRKERARLDRCCFLAARLRGKGGSPVWWEGTMKANWGRRVRGRGEISK